VNQAKRQRVFCPRCMLERGTEWTKDRNAPNGIPKPHENPMDCRRVLTEALEKLKLRMASDVALDRELRRLLVELDRFLVLARPGLGVEAPPGMQHTDSGLVVPKGT